MKQQRKHKNHKTENGMNVPERDNEYLKDLENWIENRYNPGFYTGGQIPPFIKYPTKPYGFLMLLSGFITFVLAFIARISGGETSMVFYIFILSMLSIAGGLLVILKK
jgi:hypothetical protein